MDEGITRLNIGYFKRQLADETDKTKRGILLRLLAEEEAKLAEALKRSQKIEC
jgi:hypothetical protein